MKERSLWALFALPLALAIAQWSTPGTSGPQPPPTQNPADLPKTSQKAASKTTATRKSRRLLSVCDVLSDYLGLASSAKQADNRVTIRDSRVKSPALTLNWADDTADPCDIAQVRGALAGQNIGIGSAFVFIPDPTASALALESDRSLDAIRLALNNQGYLPYRTSLFPWPSARAGERPGEREGQGADDTRTAPDADQPGVWLFRNNSDQDPNKSEESQYKRDLKLVFLIGDSPTTGISKTQFQNAVIQNFELFKGNYRARELRIVGPFFSGSINSLGQALLHACDSIPVQEACKGTKWTVTAVSGTTEVNTNRLLQGLKDVVSLNANVSYDSLLKQNGMTALLGSLRGTTAILSEADTAFGIDSAEVAEKAGVAQFQYSRDLLNLRTQYEADKDLMSRIFPKSLRPDQLALHFSMGKDPSDSVPIYAPENFAVSQQITLRHLVSNLRRRHFQNLVIVGSDNIDTVFLARFFQDEDPDLRIAVLESDALLDREAGSVSLRGLITVSQQPTGGVAGSTLLSTPTEFPDSVSAGLFLATRATLMELPVPRAMPTQLSVVGSDGEWPIRLVAKEKTDKQKSVIAADQAGDRKTLKTDSYIPATMAIIYLLILLYFKSIGGYKVLRIEDQKS